MGQGATSSAGGYCSKHGTYLGASCPFCAAAAAGAIGGTQATWANPYEGTLQRIAVALERIMAALEQLAYPPPDKSEDS